MSGRQADTSRGASLLEVLVALGVLAVVVGGALIVAGKMGERVRLNSATRQIIRDLKKMIGGKKDKLVVVKADRSVVLNKAVKVMDIAKAAGAARLCLATEKDF